MYNIVRLKSFDKAFRKLKRSGKMSQKIEDKLIKAIDTLASGKSLPKSYNDHQLRGDFAGYNECHIRGDLLLVYYIDDDILALALVDIGTHSQIFG